MSSSHIRSTVPLSDLPDYLRPIELGPALGISRSSAYQLIAAGIVPSVRISPRLIRIPKAGLILWLEGKTTGGNS